MSFSIVMEGFWDKAMSILERVIFAIVAVLFLIQDKALDIPTYIVHIQTTHIIALILFTITLYIHKSSYKIEKLNT
jgi:uncharacterized membrane protein